jgi:hypothetical protein
MQGVLREARNSKSKGETEMKNNAIRMFLAISAAYVGASALDAQTNSGLLTAKVPFAFQVRGENFTAGKYLVRSNGAMSIPSIHNTATGQGVFVAGAANVLTQAGGPRLVFHCYAGKTCFLAEIRPSSGPGSLVSMSKEEKAIAKGEANREVASIAVALQSGE